MPRFLIALICLSALAMTQNWIVATADATEVISQRAPVTTASILSEEAPRPAAVMLLIVGLSGLTAAGSRTHRRKDRASA